jgi:hypothetical protein
MMTDTTTDGGRAMEAKGHNGSVSFDGRLVTIKRSGLGRLTQAKNDKVIPLRQISAVQLKPAGMLTNGFIEFSIGGGSERGSAAGSATVNAASNENAVLFTKKQAAEFAALRDAVNQALADL